MDKSLLRSNAQFSFKHFNCQLSLFIVISLACLQPNENPAFHQRQLSVREHSLTSAEPSCTTTTIHTTRFTGTRPSVTARTPTAPAAGDAPWRVAPGKLSSPFCCKIYIPQGKGSIACYFINIFTDKEVEVNKGRRNWVEQKNRIYYYPYSTYSFPG